MTSRNSAARGSSAPLGASVRGNGANFAVFSKNATLVELLLFDDRNATQPAAVLPLDPYSHRSYHYWHVFVPGVRVGQVYGYRAHGPFEPRCGLRFDQEKVLLDPYGLALAVPDAYGREAIARSGDDSA